MSQKYEYKISEDFPDGSVNIGTFVDEIYNSSITIALEKIESQDDKIDIWFKNELESADRTILDGNTNNPAGGLIALHNNAPDISEDLNVNVQNTLNVINKKSTVEKRIYVFSCDFTRKETWYIDSIFDSDEFVSNGLTTQYSLSHGSGLGEAIIDLSHGKVTEEHLILGPSGTLGGYVPVVRVGSGAALSERHAYESSGGDYEIDYIDGTLNLFSAPTSGELVSTWYFYSASGDGPQIVAGPPSGKAWILDSAEIQFSDGIILDDEIRQNVLLDHPTYGTIKAAPDAIYSTVGNFLDYTYGAFSKVPAFGGPVRGLQSDTIILRWNYLTAIALLSSLNMRMWTWTGHGRGMTGERASVTIYGTEIDE